MILEIEAVSNGYILRKFNNRSAAAIRALALTEIFTNEHSLENRIYELCLEHRKEAYQVDDD